MAPPFREDTILQVAAAFEAATDFHTRKPVLACGMRRGL
jgi:Asp-tRNA(Asn)/Glu-tRNA(Gln) amidotransferase A subunit family amidase